MMRTSPYIRRCAFTLTELLVAIGIIAVLAALTAITVRGISNDARMASSTNTVISALDHARALAMKHSRMVMVVFRPRWDTYPRTQYIEAVLCEWTGESAINTVDTTMVVDRFITMPDVPVKRLSQGVKVACPRYGEAVNDENYDNIWVTQVHLPGIDQQSGTGEYSGGMIAVMYGPDGALRTRNSRSCADRFFVDFNLDGMQRDRTNESSGIDYDYDINGSGSPPPSGNTAYFDQDFEDDEPYITFAAFLSVFDDAAAREIRTSDWESDSEYLELIGPAETGGFISVYADRIHFNRYTGVALK